MPACYPPPIASSPLINLPPRIAAAVRVASVAPALRELARRAGPLRLRVALGTDALDRPGLLQLLKLAVVEDLEVVAEEREGESTLFLARGDDRVQVEPSALAGHADVILTEALARLLAGPELARLGLAASTELARHVALRSVAGRVLEAGGDEEAASALLGGLTSGEGLGFHRAALFVPGEGGAFVGFRAVGPSDREDAHRIWESLEEARVALEEQLGPTSRSPPLEARVRAIRLDPRDAEPGADGPGDDLDEVRAALAGCAYLFRRPDGPHAPELAALDPAPEFVLCRFATRGRIHGLLFADRRFDPVPIEEDRLQALTSFLAHAALAWEARRLLRENAWLARHDALTGLLNRRAFEEALAHAARDASRTTGLLLIDLDHFRDVNNVRGHQAGDVLLRAASQILSDELAADGIGARFGGDELAAIMPGAGAAEVARAAERIGRAAMGAGISMSVGAATCPGDCGAVDELVGAADRRLYAAKHAGRGCAFVPGSDAPLPFSSPQR